MWKEIKEQYAYLWWWLLDNGLFVATIIVNFFMLAIFTVSMTVFYFALKWFSKH
jgi:hypothetical protein